MGFFSKVIAHQYQLGKTIGKGHFSKVKQGINVKTNEPVAVKIVERRTLVEENAEECLKREIAIMLKVQHKYVTRLLDVFQTSKHVYLILELVTGGELFDKICEAKKLTEDVARKYFQQIVLGLYYCHMHGVAHRDLKPENLLLDSQGNLKISDFGLSNLQSATGSGRVDRVNQLHTMCGTPEYVAPEVIYGTGYNGFFSDVWSIGVILYVMCSGQLPFRSQGSVSVFQRVRSGVFDMKEHFSADLKDLLRHLLTVNPNARIKLEDVMKHPWVIPEFPFHELEQITTAAVISVSPAEIQHAITATTEESEENFSPTHKASTATPTSSAPTSSDSLPALPNIRTIADTTDSFEMVSDLHKHKSFCNPSFISKPNNLRFGITGEINDVVRLLVTTLEEMQAHPEQKVFTTIKGSVEKPGENVMTYSLTVTTNPKNTMICIVEYRRGRGSTLQSHEFYRELLSRLAKYRAPEEAISTSDTPSNRHRLSHQLATSNATTFSALSASASPNSGSKPEKTVAGQETQPGEVFQF